MDVNVVTQALDGGYVIGNSAAINTLNATYIGWSWKAGGNAVTNTAGSVTSQVSAGTLQGMSVVTYTSSTSAITIGHGLGVAPAMVILKPRNSGGASNAIVWHRKLSVATPYLTLDTTNAQVSLSNAFNLPPSASVINYGGWSGYSTYNMVAYCFAEVPGFSKIDSYVGNGAASGPFIYCGFKPKYIMIKCISAAGNWVVWDSARNTYNVVGEEIYPNLAQAIATTTDLDIVSNGFKIRNTTASYNTSSGTYVYMAFADTPFKYSNAR